MPQPTITRSWAMPSPSTFSIPPISALLDRWLAGRQVIVDPFCGTSTRATYSNDLQSGVLAERYVQTLLAIGVQADAILFDPPYSARQIVEVYKSVGLQVTQQTSQNGRLYKAVRDGLDALLQPGGIALSFGWNSAGFGVRRGYHQREILLVAHGGAHNDTICVVEQKGE